MLMKQHSYAFYNGHLSTVYKQRLHLVAKLGQLESIAPCRAEPSTAPPASTIDTSLLDAPPSAAQRRHSLTQLSDAERDIDRISRAIASGQQLDDEQIRLFERVVKWEVDALADELRGTAQSPRESYPSNLTLKSYYKWICLPTVVYELAYPQTDSISWPYVAEKLAALVGVLFVMIQVSQYSICALPLPPGNPYTSADEAGRSRRDEDGRDEGKRNAHG